MEEVDAKTRHMLKWEFSLEKRKLRWPASENDSVQVQQKPPVKYYIEFQE